MTLSTTSAEPELLRAAQRGDEQAFALLVAPYRAQLHAHCYRMLGSLHDAEDALQDTLVRAWRGLLPRFDSRSTLRRWLYRVATNVCLDVIARRPKRVLPIDYGPPSSGGGDGQPVREPVWLEPYPDEVLGLEDGFAGPAARYESRESIELAFVAALQHLPPRQRAVLVLREVLGFSAAEVAQLLETTVASVNSALQRARKTVEQRAPRMSQQATLRSLGEPRVREIVERLVDAFERADTEAIVSLLTEDVTFEMPPYAAWCRGSEAVTDSWLMPGAGPGALRYLPARANGQPAVGAYAWDPKREVFVAIALDVLTLRGDRIAEVTAFRMAELFPSFGLPLELQA